MVIRSRIIGGGLLIAAFVTLGCESHSPFPAKLSGKVTYKGEPLGGGTMAFYTADGQVISTDIRSDGTYVSTNLPEGTLTVTIETESVNPNKSQPEYRSPGAGPAAMHRGPTAPPGAPKGGAPKSPIPDSAPVTASPSTYVKIPAKYSDKTKSGLTITLKKGDQKHDFDLTD